MTKTSSTSFTELWAERQRIVAEIDRLAQVTDARALTDQDRAEEARLVNAITEIDGRIGRIAPHVDSLVQQRASDIQTLLSRGASLSQRDMAAVDWAKSAVLEKNPAAFVLEPDEQRDFSISQPGLEFRDTLKSTATQALPVSVYSSFMLHLVESTPVMRAGALVINTATGEDLAVPKSTAFQSSALTSEGGQITESDPTLAVVTLKAYKYAAFWQLSRELVEDSPANLLDALARGAAVSLAAAYGPHMATGNGTGQPLGYTNATVGVTGPTGTASSFGSQSTAGQGSDLLFDLYGSLAEPYLLSPAIGVLGRNASFNLWRKVKEGTTNKPMFDLTPVQAGASVNLLGQPGYVDPNAPAVGANAKSLAFGDWSRFVVRMVNGVRLERSDEFAFQNDLVSFRAVIRLDAAIVDATAVKLFAHSAS